MEVSLVRESGDKSRAVQMLREGEVVGESRSIWIACESGAEDLLVPHIFRGHFKVPICNGLWHPQRMPEPFSVSIMNEFANASLGDERLSRRLPRLAEALARQPQASIPQAPGSWGQACAACRLLAPTPFTPHDVLQPHRQRTLERATAQPTVLAVADTTSLNYSQRSATQGLGLIGSRADQFFGLRQHSLLAFTPQGLPLGLGDSQCWARAPAKFGGNHQRNRKPVADKESAQGLRSYDALQTHAAQTPRTRWVMGADREGDLYELFAWAVRPPAAPGLLVRAQHDRGVDRSPRRLFAHLARAPLAGRLRVPVPRRPGPPARPAPLSVRFRAVRVSAPTLKDDRPPLTLWAVEARELHPPRGRASLHWRLLTTDPVQTLAQATERVGWYGVRWGIEVFHKVLKSGGAVEAAQLGPAARWQRSLAIKLVIAWQVQALTHLGRGQAEADGREMLKTGQWRRRGAATAGGGWGKRAAPRAREVVRRLGRLGGHLGRRGDGPPGPRCRARGLQ